MYKCYAKEAREELTMILKDQIITDIIIKKCQWPM